MAPLTELPVELLECILHFLKTDTQSLVNLILTSRKLATITRSHLYESVHFFSGEITSRTTSRVRYSNARGGSTAFRLFLRTVKQSPLCAASVKKLVLGNPVMDPMHVIVRHDLYEEMLQCISSLPELQVLELSFGESLIKRLPDFLPISMRELNLTKVVIPYEDLIEVMGKLQHLERIHLTIKHRAVRGRDQIVGQPTAHKDLLGALPIESLEYQYQDLEDPMFLLITTARNLKTLDWKLSGSSDMMQVSKVLKDPKGISWGSRVQETLTTLSVTTMRGFDEWPGHSRWARVDLGSFSSLTSLSVHIECLYRRIKAEMRTGIYKCLPRTLEKIQILASFTKADLFHKWRYQLANSNVSGEPILFNESNYHWLIEIAERKKEHYPRLSQIDWIEETSVNKSEFRDRAVWLIPETLIKASIEARVFLSITLDPLDRAHGMWPIFWFKICRSGTSRTETPTSFMSDTDIPWTKPMQLLLEDSDHLQNCDLVPMLDLNPFDYKLDFMLIAECVTFLRRGPNQFDYFPTSARSGFEASKILSEQTERYPFQEAVQAQGLESGL